MVAALAALCGIADRVPPDFPVVAFTVTAIETLVDSLTARDGETSWRWTS